jgi:transposase-like protein
VRLRRSRAAGRGADYGFPAARWRKLPSTNPLERFNKEIGQRIAVVGIFPGDRSLIRLAGVLCIEQTTNGSSAGGYVSAGSIALALPDRDDDESNENEHEVLALQAA